MQIRDFRLADLPGVTAIYNHAVEHTTAIWNEILVDEANRRTWAEARIAQGYPLLIAEIDGRVAGYATFGDFRPHDGYRFTVEHSIYVSTDFRRRGLAREMLPILEDRARGLGKHVMVGAIAGDNLASIALHREAGYADVGRMPEVGRKFGQWLDLVLMQKILD